MVEIFTRMTRRMRRELRRLRDRDHPPAEPIAQVLQSPPVLTESLQLGRLPGSPIGVHILGQDAHLLQALWSLKSFYRFSSVNFPLTVHLQGSNTQQMQTVFQAHFPQARLISQEAANAVVEPWLEERKLQRLLALRRQFFLMMKLIDLHVLARTQLIIYLDTDVLFFRRPTELLIPPDHLQTADHLFMRDNYPSYRITREQARADLDLDLVPFANSGIMRLVTDAIDLETCERFLAHPALSEQHWHLEQTLHALYASAQGRLALLPETYAMSKGLDIDPDLVARHYTSPIRRLLAEEGIAHLLETGFPGRLDNQAGIAETGKGSRD